MNSRNRRHEIDYRQGLRKKRPLFYSVVAANAAADVCGSLKPPAAANLPNAYGYPTADALAAYPNPAEGPINPHAGPAGKPVNPYPYAGGLAPNAYVGCEAIVDRLKIHSQVPGMIKVPINLRMQQVLDGERNCGEVTKSVPMLMEDILPEPILQKLKEPAPTAVVEHPTYPAPVYHAPVYNPPTCPAPPKPRRHRRKRRPAPVVVPYNQSIYVPIPVVRTKKPQETLPRQNFPLASRSAPPAVDNFTYQVIGLVVAIAFPLIAILALGLKRARDARNDKEVAEDE